MVNCEYVRRSSVSEHHLMRYFIFFSAELMRLAEARLLSDAAAAESCISYASSDGTKRYTTAPASGGVLYPSSESLYGID